ncbi:MAG TPA: hypothetical protein VMF89_12370, partial [Polyangiales bacterium]|nr:hypothetical protein [Polyangiales bacterium]
MAKAVVRRLSLVSGWLLFVLLWAAPRAAFAQGYQAALPRLASEDVESLKQGVDELASAGDPAALPILYALRDGELSVEPSTLTLFIKKGKQLRRALDGKTGLNPQGLRQVSTSNALRRALQSALARLELFSPEVETRRKAADELANRGNPEFGPLLRKALASERDAETKRALTIALAKIDLNSDKASERLSAVQLLDRERAIAFKPLLERLLEVDDSGKPREPDDAVRAAASSALASLWWVETTTRLAGDLMY